MLCPEGTQIQNNEAVEKDEEEIRQYKTNQPETEGSTATLDINAFKNLKTWKKSITNFFRNQLRSTRSNDGDRQSEIQEKFEEKEMSPDQKWQSLGKIFRRQSFAEHCNKSPSQDGSSTQTKRLAVRRVLSSYFSKTQNSIVNNNGK